jgi:ElaB/YqjD/DUF883 family membrane-anchored ribosome-binding protein
MAERADDLQQNIEETRHDMEETRASMTEKLELLEERVRETFEETKSAVEDIVENVKDTVDETVDAVKETVGGAKSTVEDIVENVKGTMDDTMTTVKHAFDLSYQVNQYPWFMFGSAVLLGGFLGGLLQRQPQTNEYEYEEDADEADEDESYRAAFASQANGYTRKAANNFTASPERPPSMRTSQQGSGEWSGLGHFQDEFNMVKGAVISTIMGMVREMIRQNMPSVAPKLEKAIDSASQKLGAAPIEPSADPQHTNGNERQEQKSQSTTSPSRESSGQQRPYGMR